MTRADRVVQAPYARPALVDRTEENLAAVEASRGAYDAGTSADGDTGPAREV
ncbi:hypothetical protein [Streptomyces sp. SID3212]|uniref:hypothetical protein n=1 Tax=Streptomyces sp. SID3212 TaxID=2690259 RepID=UPI00136C9AC3|nr:hypothetical protein [Streptomyces sp. SID3212]MYV54781.1 hypothetical protein [Streptomyces sp. SID3212]